MTRVENILRIYKFYKQSTRGHGVIEKESIATIENNIVDRLSLSIDFKSHETSEHLDRVSSSVYILSKGMGFDNETASNYSKASKLHDIGKIGIPDSILLKKGALDDEEWKLMKSHTLIGERILSAYNTKLLNIASTIAVTHHENWDGSGYPYGLVGNQIDIAGRLTAIADVFDAMLSERSYKSPWDIDSVISYIYAQNGIKFDPKVVEVFSKELSKIMGLYKRYKYS